jgi:cellulase/cellobiase CelA1
VTNQWGGGFQASVTVRNSGTQAITGWRVTWTFANGQVITQLWDGTVSASGANVTVTNVGYNGSIAVNATRTFGFLANWNNATNAVPVVTCTAT